MAPKYTEASIIEKQISFSVVKITFLGLYRYATTIDAVLLFICAVSAILAGACQPAPTLVFSRIAYIFVQTEGTTGHQDSSSAVDHYTLLFLYIAIGSFVTQYVSTTGFIYLGAKITRRIKEHCMESILTQNVALFDERGAGEIATQLTSDAHLIQEGLSQKLALTLSAVGTLGATFIIAFTVQWKITFMLIWCIVVGVILLLGGNKIAARYSGKALEAYSAGGSLAEEALSAIRYTTALGMQRDILDRYSTQIKSAEKHGFRLKSFMGAMVGFAVGIGYVNVALAFWQGSRYLSFGSATFTAVVTITLAIKSAAFSVLGVGANAGAFVSAVAAGGRVFSLIDRISPIDSSSADGLVISDDIVGQIEFRDVKHIYPSRPSVVVADNLTLTFRPGQMTAVVGSSGAGKSTIGHLLERFYDPVAGQILLDNLDIRDINLKSLRQNIRLVDQEPSLFNTTVVENIAYGLVGTKFESHTPEKKQQMIENAARLACAHDFIMQLPDGYLTRVGARGSKLSGGQKQRIAIARALIGQPKILILDEATSALDTTTEIQVQNTLKAVRSTCTTIIIAHRLSTIQGADNIIVLDGGRIVEQGKHDHLMQLQGNYFLLVEAQTHRDSAGNTIDAKVEADLTEKRLSISKALDTQLALDGELPASWLKTSPDDLIDKSNGDSSLALARFVASLNLKELPIISLGLVCSIIAGFEEPISAILFGKAITAIALPPSEGSLLRRRAGLWSLMFLVLALVECLVFIIQGVAFAYCSERLVYRARYRALEAILRQEISFFEKEENSIGALTSLLSVESTNLAGISGATLGTILIAISTLVTAFVVGCAFGWKLALVCSSVIPVLVGSGFYGVWLVARLQEQTDRVSKETAAYATETVTSIQTVFAFTREQDVLAYFKQVLAISERAGLKTNLKTSALYALSQSLLYACMGLGFWFGGRLILWREYSTFQFVTVYSSITMGAFSAGLVFSFAPDIGKAKKSAQDFKRLFDRKSKIDPLNSSGYSVGNVQGRIEFRNVSFRYPSRPDLVLDGVSFTIEPGQHVALVGETGSGKSTIISLLERFYDPTHGEILVDGQPITTLNVKEYRQALGLVIQEPSLYDGTIRENLLLGLNPEATSDEMIASACKTANIYDFILSLPDGFSTTVGNRGSQLSGGQKQRLALARALVQRPAILLLDEATSAVDAKSEKLIQEALDSASECRTALTIAHRLSTVRNADVIYVLDQGRIIEAGLAVKDEGLVEGLD
ncbi:leptomycin B resistance protein pmd1 [Penicillium canariense]|uniref:Leptomycin B resistance protein pmd1 n=1 Tax=Penicillium canariense TaxID=189055 RepID=A0A9W9I8U5_9EURO|nr:leptomycin B resistance protein pmd1 [Penicillium canariense]KAJ5168928.1 leptomycin B resistance protein pmd1 [Penicillium canariense]